jgi:hypothetical protein
VLATWNIRSRKGGFAPDFFEILDIGMQDPVSLLLMKDEEDRGTLVAHSPESVHRWHWLVAHDEAF